MSDLGTYADIEAEIKSALTTNPIAGIADVKERSSLYQLQNETRKPVIGIIHSGTEKLEEIAVGRKDFYAVTRWTIGIVVSTARPSQENRDKLYTFMEEVRDRLHFLQSNLSPRYRFLFLGETYPQDEADLIAASISFELIVTLGK